MKTRSAVQLPNNDGKRRRRGKKSDPRFGPVTLWIDREVYFDAKRQVIGTDRDVSDLVGMLLRNWIEDQFAITHRLPSNKTF